MLQSFIDILGIKRIIIAWRLDMRVVVMTRHVINDVTRRKIQDISQEVVLACKDPFDGRCRIPYGKRDIRKIALDREDITSCLLQEVRIQTRVHELDASTRKVIDKITEATMLLVLCNRLHVCVFRMC